MNKIINAGIAGAAGYTGGELLRILLHHPQVRMVFAHSKSNAGKPVHSVHRDLVGETALYFSENMDFQAVDVLFLCLGHGDARLFLEQNAIPEQVKIIDLSQDFRLNPAMDAQGRKFVYGLPEQFREHIQTAQYIANPGCFATAIQLALLPLAHAQFIQNQVFVTGITGATGAGQSLQPALHFPWRANNISAYKTLNHQHLHEIRQTLFGNGNPAQPIHFIPWRGDFTRGIFVSCCLQVDAELGDIQRLYRNFYEKSPFVFVSDDPIDLKQVINTNKCLLHLEMADGQLVVHAIIDNLLKGASGQAVQNMNLMFGLDEKTGLSLKPIHF